MKRHCRGGLHHPKQWSYHYGRASWCWASTLYASAAARDVDKVKTLFGPAGSVLWVTVMAARPQEQLVGDWEISPSTPWPPGLWSRVPGRLCYGLQDSPCLLLTRPFCRFLAGFPRRRLLPGHLSDLLNRELHVCTNERIGLAIGSH